MRRAAKRDRIEPDVIAVLKAFGWDVLQISVKDGPDLVIGKGARDIRLVEVKSGKQKLRPGQQVWHEGWQGTPVLVFHSPEEAETWCQGQQSGPKLPMAKMTAISSEK